MTGAQPSQVPPVDPTTLVPSPFKAHFFSDQWKTRQIPQRISGLRRHNNLLSLLITKMIIPQVTNKRHNGNSPSTHQDPFRTSISARQRSIFLQGGVGEGAQGSKQPSHPSKNNVAHTRTSGPIIKNGWGKEDVPREGRWLEALSQ